jgi:hypothetical protein
MNWLEVIHLRATEHKPDLLVSTLRQLIDEVREKRSCRKIEMFKRALLETDICLQLYHDTENIETAGSTVGMHIAMALKSFGMVNHTVWIVNDHPSSQ